MTRSLSALAVFIAVVVALLLPALPIGAQSPGTIEGVRVEGNERIEQVTIETYLTVRPGDPFDPVELDNSLRAMFATGLFADVTFTRDGDILVIQIVENPIISRIAFEGNNRIDDEDLESEIDLRPRVVYTPARVQTAVSRILELYRRSGRYAAQVEPKIIRLDQNRVDLVFEIQEGPLTTVKAITFVGNEAFSDATLRTAIETDENRFWRVFSSTDTFDPDRLAFDQELLRRFYFNNGYADFEVRSAIAELTPEGDAFFITFTVDEGEQYAFGEIQIESRIRDLEPEVLEGQLVTSTGNTYDAEEIEESVTAMTDRIGQLGYAFVEIDPQVRRNVAERTIELTYVINEGPRVFIERIDIVGNVRTLDRVIRREMLLAEGDAFNSALLRESERQIRNLGFFSAVNVTTIQGNTADRTIIEIEVAERSTGELSFGAGFSTTEGPLGAVSLSERNLLGRGQDISLEFTLSARTQNIDLSFTEPYFLDTDFSAGFDLFRRQTDFEDESSFNERSTGFALRGGYPLTDKIRHDVRYTLRNDDIFDVPSDASVFIQEEEGEELTSAFGQTFRIDQRDNRFLPNEGYLLRLDQDIAGAGGDVNFFRNAGTASYFQPIIEDEVVLNLQLNAGYIFAFSGDDVGLSNRFFIGGQSFRGFQFAGIGPRDSETQDALGGNLFYVGTAEARFPLGLPEELRVFGRSFIEAGSLTGIDVSGPTLIDDGTIRVSAGVGLSWFSPFGPVSIDFAQALQEGEGDRTEVVQFSFGTRF